MATPSLDNLPPEILDNIVNLIEDEFGWDDFPTDDLLNMRETCRTLERACHQRFLLYFHEWVVDTKKDRDLSITKAVLASHVHVAAIEKITFVFKREGLGLWQLAPLLQEVFGSLASLDRQLILVLDPFADFEDEDEITTSEVTTFFDMILVLAAASKLAISAIHVRARREDWDKRHIFLRKSGVSLERPYRTFPNISYSEILESLHQVLDIESFQGNRTFPALLVAKYPSIGDVSFDYLKGCLKMRNLGTFHLKELREWTEELECNELRIKGSNLNPSELKYVLTHASMKTHPIRRLAIVDTVLYKETSRYDEGRPRTSVHRLIRAIIPYARDLTYLRLENIWVGKNSSANPFLEFSKNAGGLTLRGKDEIRMQLVRSSPRSFNEDANDEDGTDEGEDVSESDTS